MKQATAEGKQSRVDLNEAEKHVFKRYSSTWTMETKQKIPPAFLSVTWNLSSEAQTWQNRQVYTYKFNFGAMWHLYFSSFSFFRVTHFIFVPAQMLLLPAASLLRKWRSSQRAQSCREKGCRSQDPSLYTGRAADRRHRSAKKLQKHDVHKSSQTIKWKQ